MRLVIVGGADEQRVAAAVEEFERQGWTRVESLAELPATDAVLGAPAPAARLLTEADDSGIRYVLVHHGPDAGELGGTYERAHHRVESPELPELGRRLRSRDQVLVRCVAFAFKRGIPEHAAWVVDTRFLDNPYWVPDLRDLDGLDEGVRRYVLEQPGAIRLLDGITRVLIELLPQYEGKGRMDLTVAFGCTGGRHRSVALAWELQRRLSALGVDAVFEGRDLQ